MWLWIGAALAGCDVTEVVAGAEAIAPVEGEMRVAIAAAAFGEACSSIPLGKAIDELANGSPDMRKMLELKITAENPARWMEVCGGTAGLRAAAETGALIDAERRTHLWKTCDLGKTKWMTEAEWLGADGLYFLPFMVGAELTAAKVGPKPTRVLVRALAGLED